MYSGLNNLPMGPSDSTVEAFEPAMYLSAMSEFMIAPSTRRARVT